MGLNLSNEQIAKELDVNLSDVQQMTIQLREGIVKRLLLDSRVVDVPMAYTPTFVTLSSVTPCFFNGLQNA